MNALGAIEKCPVADPWDEATERVNRWRGQALQYFAQAEWAVSETLLAMRAQSPPGQAKRLPPLAGPRFERLRVEVGPEGAFAGQGKRAAAALEAFAPHFPLRPFLCHGTAKVTLDRHGQWLVVLTLLSFSKKEEARARRALSEREAEAILAELKAAGKALGSALQSLRDRIGRTPMGAETMSSRAEERNQPETVTP